jgi:ATP-dependent helicase/nuclease subunit A
LVVAGALGKRAAGVPPLHSWYATCARAMTALGVPEVEPGDGQSRLFLGKKPLPPIAPRADVVLVSEVRKETKLPEWIHAPAPQESRPPRPLAPSQLGEDMVADPPPTPAMRAAAERGRLIHCLLERVPPVAPEQRRGAAERWLTQAAGVEDAALRADVTDAVFAILDDPAYAPLFGPGSLAEAPIAATLANGLVVSGRVDRLLIGAEGIRLIDYKTGRRAPGGIGDVPVFHLAQMAGYAAALEVIFPGRPVSVALLYTAGPRLITVPEAVLAVHKPGYRGGEQSLALGG